jgi:hypothetical protein
MCSDTTLQKEVGAVSHFLGQLADNQCPASALSPSTSKFFAQVVELAEGFIAGHCAEKVGMFGRTMHVRGKPAMEILYAEFDSNGGDVSAEKLGQLRSFQWMLTEVQRKKVQDQINVNIVEARNVFMAQKALTADPATKAMESSSVSSSSGSSLVQASAAVQLAATKRKVAALGAPSPSDGAKKASTARLRSIFRGKSFNY